jgi:hypothetical protein
MYVKDTFDLLEEQHISLCLHDKLGSKIVDSADELGADEDEPA